MISSHAIIDDNLAQTEKELGGRKQRMTVTKAEPSKRLLANGIPPKEVANNLGGSAPTLYRWLLGTARP